MEDAPEDLSKVLVKISIALQRLGWSREQVQGILEERYGEQSLHYLTPTQLLDWLNYLSSVDTVECGLEV